jgi:hypothetical protein
VGSAAEESYRARLLHGPPFSVEQVGHRRRSVWEHLSRPSSIPIEVPAADCYIYASSRRRAAAVWSSAAARRLCSRSRAARLPTRRRSKACAAEGEAA